MDIQKSREEFEKLPEITKNIDEYVFCEMENKYKELNVRYALGRIKINGAWYAFQEQQKKINEIKAMAESWINQDYTHNSDSTDIKIQQMKDCGRDIIRKINGE